MAKFAPYSRQELRRSFIVWLKRNTKVVTRRDAPAPSC